MPSFSISTQAGSKNSEFVVNEGNFFTAMHNNQFYVGSHEYPTNYALLTNQTLKINFGTNNYNHYFEVNPGALNYYYPNNFNFSVSPGGIYYNNTYSNYSFNLSSGGIHYENDNQYLTFSMEPYMLRYVQQDSNNVNQVYFNVTTGSMDYTGSSSNVSFHISANDGITYSSSGVGNLSITSSQLTYSSNIVSTSFGITITDTSIVYSNHNNVNFSVTPGGVTYTLGADSANPTCAFKIDPGAFSIQYGGYVLSFVNSSNQFVILPTGTAKPTYLQRIRFGLNEASSRDDLSANFKTYIATKDDLLIVLDELYTAVQDLESRVSALEGN